MENLSLIKNQCRLSQKKILILNKLKQHYVINSSDYKKVEELENKWRQIENKWFKLYSQHIN